MCVCVCDHVCVCVCVCVFRDAWHKLGSMLCQDAMLAYINLVTELNPKWRHSVSTGESLAGNGGGGGGGGPVVSTLMKDEEVIPDQEKSLFDWCKEGNGERLAAMLDREQVNDKDEEVCMTEGVKSDGEWGQVGVRKRRRKIEGTREERYN